ncbi:GNAT family N-acetyltransferase [Hippea alviniae]|uniref:GNAT family N-acetyltransferase n=1 Tax=Hippea alviniae TaxID=1279027 RepID=UPI0003B6B6A1|nr:GNAT family N-acetyltransferase [Hippea alviniae]
MNFRLTVENDIGCLPVVKAFISKSAEVAGFSKESLTRFELIAEESFVYILRNSFEEDEKGLVDIDVNIDESHLCISFRDKGIPFGDRVAENDQFSKLQLALLKNTCDKIEWLNHGKEGKELKITFFRPKKDITQYAIPFLSKHLEPTDNISIELLNPEDAYQVSQLIYKTCGYTYPSEDVYYPERIEELNRKGGLISIVAIDKTYNRIVGHYAIERHGFYDVGEIGKAIVEPSYRGRGILSKMREKLEETAKSLRMKGIFSQPVMSHTRTQKVNEKFGSKVCGVSFGLVPKNFNYKKMEIKPLSERETCLFYFKSLSKEHLGVFIPEKHKDMIEKIYVHHGFEIEEPKPVYFKTTKLDAKYNTSWGFGTINVVKVGKDLFEKIKASFNHIRFTTQAEVIFLNISLGDRPIDDEIEKIESLGFFFSGIIPFGFFGKDLIRFQYLNTLVNVERLKVYGEFAKELFGYSVSMMKRVFE